MSIEIDVRKKENSEKFPRLMKTRTGATVALFLSETEAVYLQVNHMPERVGTLDRDVSIYFWVPFDGEVVLTNHEQ